MELLGNSIRYGTRLLVEVPVPVPLRACRLFISLAIPRAHRLYK